MGKAFDEQDDQLEIDVLFPHDMAKGFKDLAQSLAVREIQRYKGTWGMGRSRTASIQSPQCDDRRALASRHGIAEKRGN
jgi:hypothetical protein